jgi:HEAT repeat protein
VLDDVRVGFDEVRASPLLRLVAVAYVLFAVLGFSVNFPFLLETRAAFPDEAEFARITAIIGAVIAAISLVVALVVANRFYARFGVAAAALLLPLVYVVGFSIWLGWFSFPTAALVVVAQQSTQRGLSNAAWSAFYNIVPAAKRAQVLAFQDGVPGQVGTILSGVLLLVAGGTAALEPVFGLGLVAALVCTVVVIAIRRRYAEALLRTLRSGVGEQVLEGGPGLGELLRVPDVRSALVAALSAPEAGTRSLAASLLARSPTPDARAALAGVFEDPDPEVRAIAAAAVLQETDRGPEEARAEQCLVRLSTGDADERAAGLRAIHRLGRDLPPGDRAVFLSDPDPSVRAMTMVVLSRASDEAATTALLDGLGDPEPIVRRAASAALAARPASDPRVVARLSDPSDDVQAAAIAALDGHGATAGDAVRSWAARRVARATDLREACRALRISSSTIEVADDGSTDFLLFTLDERVARHESMALLAMSVLGAPAGPGVIRRTLRSRDPDVRAQAIEALDSVGDRRLGSSIATLVEGGGPSGSGADPATTLRRLRDDDDPWIRGLAARVGTNGVEMADAARSLGDIDTMLRLRRVPLFARLSPEDLQRVAMVATERVFEPDATIVREGDDGDELYVILEGRVVVTRLEPDGSERRVRTYEAGDHFGELAVLREAPRAATVSADGVTVRTLVVAGDGLASILRERPDAAMAMLATLAERISVQ